MNAQEPATNQPPGAQPPDGRRLPRSERVGVLVIVVVMSVAFASCGGGGESNPNTTAVPTTVTEPAPPTPLEVATALNMATIAGDWEAAQLLYASDATFTLEPPGGEPFGIVPTRASLAEPLVGTSRYTIPFFTSFDWDGDGIISGFDDIAAKTMADYAIGVEPYGSCLAIDSTSVDCGPPDRPATMGLVDLSERFEVVDGLITHHVVDFNGADLDRDFSVDYQVWVRANRPELNEDDALFEAFGRLLITPDTVETHRELVVEWNAQR